MATAIDMEGKLDSGRPLTAAPITLTAATEEAVTFTNCTKQVSLVITTALTDATYGFSTGETGGQLLAGSNVIEAFHGRPLYIKSATGGDVSLRIQ